MRIAPGWICEVHCFCRLVSTYLSTLLFGTHPAQFLFQPLQYIKYLVCPLGKPLYTLFHKGGAHESTAVMFLEFTFAPCLSGISNLFPLPSPITAFSLPHQLHSRHFEAPTGLHSNNRTPHSTESAHHYSSNKCFCMSEYLYLSCKYV